MSVTDVPFNWPVTVDLVLNASFLSDADKTAAVHFLRFQLSAAEVLAFKQGTTVKLGIDHPAYCAEVTLSPSVRTALAGDLD